MGKVYVRIDDRLIHGQIMAAWCNYLDVTEIVGIDDKTANNQMLKQIMTMSVPKKYQCSIITIAEAKEKLNQETSGNRLVILRFPEKLEELREELKGAEMIIIGNVAKKPDSKYEASSGTSIFFLTEKDVEVLNAFSQGGMKVIFRTVPTSSEKSWEGFMKSKH
nr:PTS sugar transporter subunit IIB [uncultured Caproiciproducens sp.]